MSILSWIAVAVIFATIWGLIKRWETRLVHHQSGSDDGPESVRQVHDEQFAHHGHLRFDGFCLHGHLHAG